jgi:putative transposase
MPRSMTSGDIAAHLQEVYDTAVSRDFASTVTAKVAMELNY